jgi:hypothetical protein
MSGQPPLDLRALGEVGSPEVVHEALRRFRRRILTRSVWVVAAGVLGVLAILWARSPSSLADRVDASARGITAHPIWHANGVTVALDRVADLGDGRLGFHFVVLGRGLPSVQMSGQVASESVGFADRYIEIEPPAEGYPTLTILAHGERTTIPLGPGSGISMAVWELVR